MTAQTQTCCCCFSLRTGCILIGILGIFIGIHGLVCTSGWPISIIDIISNVLLIVGAAFEIRLCLLPSMIINVLINIVLWILVLVAAFASSTLQQLISENVGGFSREIPRGVSREWDDVGSSLDSAQNVATVFLVGFVLLFVAAAVIHLLITKVILNHFTELGIQRVQFQHQQIPMFISSNTFVSHPLHSTSSVYGLDAKPLIPIQPATVYPLD